LSEHVAVQLLQPGAGLQAELLAQHRPQDAVAVQRVGLPPGPVQRQDPRGVQPLIQRMLGDQVIQLAQQDSVPAQRQVRLDSRVERGQPQLLQPSG
jgi:hypothetical protein